jgi:hypothetical protein
MSLLQYVTAALEINVIQALHVQKIDNDIFQVKKKGKKNCMLAVQLEVSPQLNFQKKIV